MMWIFLALIAAGLAVIGLTFLAARFMAFGLGTECECDGRGVCRSCKELQQ